ncbi:MAG: hypothetical protein O7E52_12965 [Candidatus Poribacteria bacterium]|nr:hypothetical protein [Candidatus Poribacteria bacterium]
MNSPVQSITGQVEIIYEKAIAEIEQEEAKIEDQISKLIEKKATLSKRREYINALQAQVEAVTEEISSAEETYQAELKKKAELDSEVHRLTEALKKLKADSESITARLEETKNVRRLKYQALAEMVEKFGDSITRKLPDEVVADLEQTARDPEDDQRESSDDLTPDEEVFDTADSEQEVGEISVVPSQEVVPQTEADESDLPSSELGTESVADLALDGMLEDLALKETAPAVPTSVETAEVGDLDMEAADEEADELPVRDKSLSVADLRSRRSTASGVERSLELDPLEIEELEGVLADNAGETLGDDGESAESVLEAIQGQSSTDASDMDEPTAADLEEMLAGLEQRNRSDDGESAESVLEAVQGQSATDASGMDEPVGADLEEMLAGLEQHNRGDEEKSAESEIQAVQRQSSTEADRLKQVFESSHSDADGADEVDLDFENLDEGQEESDSSKTDEADMEDFDKLFSQIDAGADENLDELSSLDDEAQVSDTDEEEEVLTPKTAKTPRKRRNLLTSYLDK